MQSSSRQAAVLAGYRRLLATRRQQPAFHPDGPQQVWTDVPSWLVAVLRTSPDGRQRILVLVNVSQRSQSWELPPEIAHRRPARDLLSGRVWPSVTRAELGALETVWLEFTD
jgi:sucrose phosphorylase